MVLNRTDTNFRNSYADKNMQTCENKLTQRIKIIICMLLFAIMALVQKRVSSLGDVQLGVLTGNAISGIFAQLQVMISVYLVVSIKKRGYVIAFILNMLEFCMVLIAVILNRNVDAAPGITVSIGTIIIINIIFHFSKRLACKVAEVVAQKEELVALCDELTAAQEELIQKNEQLIEYNKAMKENEEKLNHLAFFDVLTELPNRKMIIRELDVLIKKSLKNNMKFMVVFIDLDNFKNVNDSMGHHAGDLLLCDVTSKLKMAMHCDDMLGRLGGDEFLLIIQRQLNMEQVLEYIESLRIVVDAPFLVENTKFNISASFGVSIYPQDSNDSEELIKCADKAMYKAKDYGKNGIKFFCNQF